MTKCLRLTKAVIQKTTFSISHDDIKRQIIEVFKHKIPSEIPSLCTEHLMFECLSKFEENLRSDIDFNYWRNMLKLPPEDHWKLSMIPVVNGSDLYRDLGLEQNND